MSQDQTHSNRFLIRFFSFLFALVLFIVSAYHVFAWSALNTTLYIDSVSRYAWSENAGWVDFGNVSIVNTAFTGSAYGENIGWIDMSGVSLVSNGALQGYAWSENTGWIDFSGVTLGQNGAFTGKAYGENIGWITFGTTSSNIVALANIPPEFGSEGVTAYQIATSSNLQYDKVSVSYSIKDADTSMSPHPGQLALSFEYNIGSGWWPISSQYLNAGDTDLKTVNADSALPYTAYWNVESHLPNTYAGSAQVRVTVDDNRGTSHITQAVSSAFTVDTKSPTISLKLDISAGTTTVAASDDTTIASYTLGNTDPVSGTPVAVNAQTVSAKPTWASNGTTYKTSYVSVSDIYGNTATTSAVAPYSPQNIQIKDTSNVGAGTYREFLSWTTYTSGTNTTFSKYQIFRAISEGGTYSQIGEISNIATNYYTDSTVSSGATYWYKVRIVDTDSDISDWSTVVNDKVDGSGGTDTTPPTISGVATTTSSTWAKITWTTDKLASSSVDYGFTNTYGTSATSTSFVTAHEMTLIGLTPNKNYFFRVKSTDANNNTVTDDNSGQGYTFSTVNGTTISSVAVQSVTDTAASILWNTNSSSDSYVVYATTTADILKTGGGTVVGTTDLAATSTAGLYGHKVDLSGLVASNTYYFYVRSSSATDTNGGNYYRFSTSLDKLSPVVSDVTIGSITQTSAIVTWTTDKLSKSQVFYGTTTLQYASSTDLEIVSTIQHTATLSNLSPETDYFLYVKALDAQQNIGVSDEKTFKTLPVRMVSITAGPIAVPQSTWAKITWTTDDLSDSVVDFGTTTSFGFYATSTDFVTAHEVNVSGLSSSTAYLYKIHSTDANGNTATLDNGAAGYPFTTTGGTVISSVAVQSVTDSRASIVWNTDTDSDSYVIYSNSKDTLKAGDGNTVGTSVYVGTSTAALFQHGVDIDGLSPSAQYFFYVKSTDASTIATIDNNNGDYYAFSTTLDKKPPGIANISVPFLTSTSAVISWTTDKLSDARVSWGSEANTETNITPQDTTMSIMHISTVTGLTPSTKYFFTVRSQDEQGNLTLSDEQNFTTEKDGTVKVVYMASGGGGNTGEIVDHVPPTISNISATSTAFGAVVNFSTDKDSTAYVMYGKDTTYGDVAAAPEFSQNHSVALNRLRMGTTYHFKIKSEGRAGNFSESPDQTFTTEYAAEDLQNLVTLDNASEFQDKLENLIENVMPSLAKPFIGGVTVSSTTESSAVVSWKTNVPTYGQVSYVVDSSYNAADSKTYTSQAAQTDKKSVDHDLQLTNLAPAAKYHFRVESYSLPGVVGYSKDNTFTTEAAKIQTEVAKVENKAFEVRWTSKDKTSSVVEYKNLKTGKISRIEDPEQVLNHNIRVENLDPNTPYTVKAYGFDANSIKVEGAELSINTKKDITAPKISNIKVDNAILPGQTSKLQTVISWKTDEPADSSVYYEEGASQNTDLKNKSITPGLSTEHIVIISALKVSTVYRIKIASADDAGNVAESPVRTILTPHSAENVLDIIVKNLEESFGFLKQLQQ